MCVTAPPRHQLIFESRQLLLTHVWRFGFTACKISFHTDEPRPDVLWLERFKLLLNNASEIISPFISVCSLLIYSFCLQHLVLVIKAIVHWWEQMCGSHRRTLGQRCGVMGCVIQAPFTPYFTWNTQAFPLICGTHFHENTGRKTAAVCMPVNSDITQYTGLPISYTGASSHVYWESCKRGRKV